MSNEILSEERVPCRVYLFRGFTWVPHYTKRHIYVSPNGIELRVDELEHLGATKSQMNLWIRRWAVTAKLQRRA